jgi:hypothetical protein
MTYELTKNYSKNESQPCIYMFEAKITNKENETTVKRLSTMCKEGDIMSTENNIKNIKITVICMDNLKTTVIRKKFNNINEPAILLYKDNIIIIMNADDDNIDIKYQIIE